MKQSHHLLATVAAFLSTMCLAACQSAAPGLGASATLSVSHAPTEATTNTGIAQQPTLTDKPTEESRPSCRTCPRERDPLFDPESPLSKREVFFGFDQYQVTPEAQALLEQHARYLANRPQLCLRLEGHADQRGSSEYNLALGQMRAQSVARMLMLLGAVETQLDVVSYGEERPRAFGDNEAAWQQNRRVDLVYAR